MRILKDEASEVRLALFKGLESLNQVVGIDLVQSKLLPCLKELQQEKSKNWRLRITVIEQYPMLAKQLGEDFFNEKLNSMCKVSLRDPVFTVREAAIANYVKLAETFGDSWVAKVYMPALLELHKDKNYLHRLTALFGIGSLAHILTPQTVQEHVVPLLMAMHKDPVANIRLNVAKTLE